jgi:acyl-CoA thioesterase
VAEPDGAGTAEPAGPFTRDTAVRRREVPGGGQPDEALFDANVADGWKAGRGPHGGYLAAMLLQALEAALADQARAARSLTIHYARAPEPGPVRIATRIERSGRSLSTLSARMAQEGRLIALVLASFSVPWSGPEIDDLPLPDVEPPSPDRQAGTARSFGAPAFTEHLVMQQRFQGAPLTGERRPMEVGAWIGLAEARVVDAPALAFFSDALLPSPFMAIGEPAAAPTIDLTVHFRSSEPRTNPRELVYAETSSKLVHEGFFEEDGIIWAADGTVLAQSRQLAILLPWTPSG